MHPAPIRVRTRVDRLGDRGCSAVPEKREVDPPRLFVRPRVRIVLWGRGSEVDELEVGAIPEQYEGVCGLPAGMGSPRRYAAAMTSSAAR